jgi:hypothetical protein
MGKACSTQNIVGNAYFTLVGKFHCFATTDIGFVSDNNIKIDRKNSAATRRRDPFCLPLVLC